jgi:A/G-specific adenine glycosylase
MHGWFSKKLQYWYKENKRDLPWRNTSDPYRIWLSEVILQQTQVAQGQSYYLRFIELFPQVRLLATASEDEVLKLWQGLGYYSRARNLHAAAKHIVAEHKGIFPGTFDEIRKLKGVGDYTAAAVGSIAFNIPQAAVDGNVYRVLSRVFGIHTPIDSSEGKKIFRNLANELLDRKSPGEHNQAIMEFGALHCRPANPGCDNCVLSAHCMAFKDKNAAALPVKARRVKVKERFFNYLVIGDSKGRVRVNRRSGNDIWKGLYEFSLLESKKLTHPKKLLASNDVKTLISQRFGIKHVSEIYTHVLTHQRLNARFYVIRTEAALNKNASIPLRRINALAFPALITKFLKEHDLKEIL